MKPSFVLPLSQRNAKLEEIGEKGLSLTCLINAGFPVPDRFHITTVAYRAFVTANNLQTKILVTLETVGGQGISYGKMTGGAFVSQRHCQGEAL